MKRREAIKGLGLSFGALLLTPSAMSLLQSCANDTGPIWEPVFFNKNQVQFLNKLTDIILPKTSDTPSATEVNVPQFIDKFISEAIEVEEQQVLKQGFSNICNALLKTNKKEELDDLKPEEIEPLLAEILKKSKVEEEMLWERYGEAIENETAVSEEIANYVALSNVRGLCIFAYKNSEFIGEEVLVYRPVPGKQEGCIDLSETGGKAYSL
jgi:hypothetical protein